MKKLVSLIASLLTLQLLSVSAWAELNPVQQMIKQRVINFGFKPNLEEISKHDLGTKGNPVRAKGLKGEYSYIEYLDCDNGAIPEYKRDGSAGIGPYGYELDKYVLRCEADTVEMFEIYMDLYHDETETVPIKGFTTWR